MSGEANTVPNDEMVGLFSLMQQKMEERPKLLSSSAGKSECCIFRVPRDLVKINEEAYYPHVVSIGPYHYGEEHLQMLQERKWRFLRSLLARSEPHGIHLQDLIGIVLQKEGTIRESYSECINKFSRSELVMMMVLDGCFIIELLSIVGKVVQPESREPIFKGPWIFPTVLLDLLQLENQIPYIVLQELFEKTRASRAGNTGDTANITLVDLALKFFNLSTQRPSHIITSYCNRINQTAAAPAKHLLDLYRTSFLPLPGSYAYRRQDGRPPPPLISSTKMLRKAGLKFRKKKSAKSFLEISFKKGSLEIPFFTMDGSNRRLLLNFVAFEQCYGYCSKDITSFAKFMGCLIKSTTDSEHLQSKQIIENYVGPDEEVVRFFDQICNNAVFDMERSYLASVFEGINKYSSNRWRVGWAGIMYTYFGAPWAWIAALGALLGLLLTGTQTAFAVLSYVNPPK